MCYRKLIVLFLSAIIAATSTFAAAASDRVPFVFVENSSSDIAKIKILPTKVDADDPLPILVELKPGQEAVLLLFCTGFRVFSINDLPVKDPEGSHVYNYSLNESGTKLIGSTDVFLSEAEHQSMGDRLIADIDKQDKSKIFTVKVQRLSDPSGNTKLLFYANGMTFYKQSVQ